MPRKCTICEHLYKDEINKALLKGDVLRNIAKRFGTSITALHRHKKEHIPISLIQAKNAKTVASADSLLGQVSQLHDKALYILAQAELAGDLRTALQGIREARSCLELLAKMQGELVQEGTINYIPQRVGGMSDSELDALLARYFSYVAAGYITSSSVVDAEWQDVSKETPDAVRKKR